MTGLKLRERYLLNLAVLIATMRLCPMGLSFLGTTSDQEWCSVNL